MHRVLTLCLHRRFIVASCRYVSSDVSSDVFSKNKNFVRDTVLGLVAKKGRQKGCSVEIVRKRHVPFCVTNDVERTCRGARACGVHPLHPYSRGASSTRIIRNLVGPTKCALSVFLSVGNNAPFAAPVHPSK